MPLAHSKSLVSLSVKAQTCLSPNQSEPWSAPSLSARTAKASARPQKAAKSMAEGESPFPSGPTLDKTLKSHEKFFVQDESFGFKNSTRKIIWNYP